MRFINYRKPLILILGAFILLNACKKKSDNLVLPDQLGNEQVEPNTDSMLVVTSSIAEDSFETDQLPYQLLGPMAELNTKYPQPNKLAAATTGRIKLPRVNFNSERAASSGNTNAANKFIQSQAAGPGAISAMMATNEKQRTGNLNIANAEARQNKALAAQEEMGNLRASQFDAQNVTRARQFNAATQNQRDQNEYEKRMLAFNQLGTNAAQYANDIRSYKGEERFAEASQISGEYTRQKYLEELRKQSKRKKSDYFGMNDTQLREQAAKMSQGAPTYNAQDRERVGAVTDAMNQAAEPAQSKRGGYVRKIGKIKRKRKYKY